MFAPPPTHTPPSPFLGIITTFAGTGTRGSAGDGGQANLAQLSGPTGVAIDRQGNVFIAEIDGHRVRRVDAVTRVISTFAGTGVAGSAGAMGGQATLVQLNSPSALAVDSADNLLIAEANGRRARKVTPGGVITLIAGTGAASSTGDGFVATLANLNVPYGIAVRLFCLFSCVYVVRAERVQMTCSHTNTHMFKHPLHSPKNAPPPKKVDAADNVYISEYQGFVSRQGNPGGELKGAAAGMRALPRKHLASSRTSFFEEFCLHN